jgi:hypothetical protein
VGADAYQKSYRYTYDGFGSVDVGKVGIFRVIFWIRIDCGVQHDAPCRMSIVYG